jgi:hypothetical protein
MKKCDYCGRDNDETQFACSGCGTPLDPADRGASLLDRRMGVCLGVGWILQTFGYDALTKNHEPHLRSVGVPFVLAGYVLSFWGCSGYAAAKGYPRWLGLLGVLCCPGFLVLMALPQRRIKGGDATPESGGSDDPGRGGTSGPPF